MFGVGPACVEIERHVVRSGCILDTEHVKGHQTSKTNQLPFKAQLNNYTDSLATKALQLPTKDTTTWEQFPRAVLYIDNKPVTANHDAIIRKKFLSTRIRNYYQTKYP
jgi:hypothetical protein